MSRHVVAAVAIVLGLFVIACGGSSSGSAVTVVPGTAATSAPAAQATDVPGIATVVNAVKTTLGPEPTDAAAAAPAIAKVGDRVELNGMALTVTKVERATQLGQFNKADDGKEFVVAEVIIENVSADNKVPYNPLYFTVKDGEGFEYNAQLVAGDQALKSGDLAKGEKARGNVAFEVKKDTKGLVMEYKPLVVGESEAIKVALD